MRTSPLKVLHHGWVFLVLAACGPDGASAPHPNPGNLQPLTVVIDTNQTMQAQAGQGVGVFVEYRTGGHWHVWWTCDTLISGAQCTFAVTATVSDVSLTNPVTAQFSSTDSVTSSTSQVSAETTTTTQVAGVTFDTTPGDKLTVDAAIAGIPRDGSYFFFVQNGLVNGNYNGALTDPLVFEPSTP